MDVYLWVKLQPSLPPLRRVIKKKVEEGTKFPIGNLVPCYAFRHPLFLLRFAMADRPEGGSIFINIFRILAGNSFVRGRRLGIFWVRLCQNGYNRIPGRPTRPLWLC